MKTADDFHVSSVTLMCEHHESQALAMIAQVVDQPDEDDAWNMTEVRRYLDRERLTCVEQCGRTEESGR